MSEVASIKPIREALEQLKVPTLIIMLEEGMEVKTDHLVDKTIDEIVALFDQYCLVARKDELTKAFTQVVGDGNVSLRSKFVKRFNAYLKERYAYLTQASGLKGGETK